VSAGRYRQLKATKGGGRGDRASEHRRVPWKQGNRPEGPCGGKEVSGQGTGEGTDGGNPES